MPHPEKDIAFVLVYENLEDMTEIAEAVKPSHPSNQKNPPSVVEDL